MERRDFLQLCALISIQPLATKDLGKDLLSSASAKATSKKGVVFIISEGHDGQPGSLRRFDWDHKTSVLYPIPLSRPHSLVQDHRDPEVVYIFEVFGSYARVNLRTKQNLVVDHRTSRQMSYGHAVQAESGELICTMNDLTRGRTLLLRKNSESLVTTGELPSECDNSHHVALLPKSPLGVCGVGAGGRKDGLGAVTFFERETGRVTKCVPLPQTVIHVFPISSDEVIAFQTTAHAAGSKPDYEKSSKENGIGANAVKQYLPAPIHYVKADGTAREIFTGAQHDLFRFNFSFAKIPNSEFMVTSHLGSDRVIVWEKDRVKKIIELPFPTNLKASDDGSEFMVVTAGQVKIFSVATLAEIMTISDDFRAVGVSTYKS